MAGRVAQGIECLPVQTPVMAKKNKTNNKKT
jgi:hypothetical protein